MLAAVVMYTAGVLVFAVAGHYFLGLDKQHNAIYSAIGGMFGALITLV